VRNLEPRNEGEGDSGGTPPPFLNPGSRRASSRTLDVPQSRSAMPFRHPAGNQTTIPRSFGPNPAVNAERSQLRTWTVWVGFGRDGE